MKVKVKAPRKGLQIYKGGKAEPISHNLFSNAPTLQFNGKSHKKGGIDIAWNNSPAEVEGGETGIVDDKGDLNIMGNMYVPGTKIKFKNATKKIAKAEKKAVRKMNKADEILSDHILDSTKFGKIATNSGNLMGIGAMMRQKNLDNQKGYLVDLQNAMLDTAKEFNLDPKAMSKGKVKKAKNGAKIGENGIKMPDGGRLSMQELNNLMKAFGRIESSNNYTARPNDWKDKGLTAYGRYQFTKGTRDGYYKQNKKRFKVGFGIDTLSEFEKRFKTDPEVQDAVMALQLNHLNEKYDGNIQYMALAHRLGEPNADSLIKTGQYTLNGKTLGWDDAISSSTTGTETPGDYVKKITGTNPVFTVTGSDHNYQPVEKTSLGTPEVALNTPPIHTAQPLSPTGSRNTSTGEEADQPTFTNLPRKEYKPSPLPFSQILPELVAFGNNAPEGVQGQSYTPRLFQPYQISLQDQLNENQATFRGLEKTLGNNPEYLSTLAAKKYQANQGILGNEFRTNQQINNQVINKNTGLLNEAEMVNLKLGDQQYVRQQQADSKTKAVDNAIISSIATKLNQNRLENKKMAAYSQMFPYYQVNNDSGEVSYVGPDYIPGFTKPKKKSASNGALIKEYLNK